MTSTTQQHFGPVPDFPIKSKIVVITGGGSGIGLALARLCHSQGARVLIGDLKLTKEGETFTRSDSAGAIIFEKCDVSSWKSLHDLISASVTAFGDVPDVYVPCAGVFEPRWSNFWDDSEDEYYKMLRINVDHPIKFTRLAVKALAGAEKQGVVCLVASTAGIRANYIASLYSASKFAVVGFAKSMGQADPDVSSRGNPIAKAFISYCLLPAVLFREGQKSATLLTFAGAVGGGQDRLRAAGRSPIASLD
jgi:NAD(P)-dependent dehydrogenase (short-subunit alcohol dehydrogenase family)